MVVCNLAAQQVPFNAIFLISDPMQKWRLFANFVLYFLPFLAGALYLGVIFLKAQKTFSRVYFADLVGSGLCGLTVLLAMYLWRPDDLIMAPLVLWLAGGVLWFVALGDRRGVFAIVVVAILAAAVHHLAPQVLGVPKLAVSDYKGVSYARKFPDNKRVYERASPFGYIEVYSSSYLHFAPGQSDNAAFNLKKMPSNAYLGLYIDSEGPAGIIKDLPADETAYFKYLPMYYPYLLKKDPEDLRGPVRRRHLDGGGAEVGFQPGDGGRGQSRAADSFPRGQAPARLHRRHPEQPQGQRHRL